MAKAHGKGSSLTFTNLTVTDSGSGFVTAGFKAGDLITVSGSTSNDGNYTIVTVAAGTLTLGDGVLALLVRIGTNVKYAIYVFLGTVKMRARPVLRTMLHMIRKIR